ncbi:Signal transduction histidine kinase [Ferrimonas sediminum]|uniref:histidine kinase n=1 Tax=Ferrimonas sediminum TaxID=718193 RepID=A0A1G8R7P2_9GAMM|nr:response regulator [Ferrimonas sediminum]SDJ13024.1 Signal transduction histidine kinase [Ferrimonas sediminum]
MTDLWQKRYQRERRAREQAEALLETKSLELYELNRKLEATNLLQAGEIKWRQRFDACLLGVSRDLLSCNVSAPFDTIRDTQARLGALLSAAWIGLEWGRGRSLCWPVVYNGPWPKHQSGPLAKEEPILSERDHRCGYQAVATGVSLIVVFSEEVEWREPHQDMLRDLALLFDAFYNNWLAFTQLKLAEQETHRMSTLRSRFLAMVTHELRTPMNGVLGCADLLASSPLNSEQQQLLRVLTHSGHSLLALINDVLDYNKIDSDQFCLNDKPIDLHQLCRDTLEVVRPMASDKGLSLTCEVKGELPDAVCLDPSRYKQVLLNLLGNAVNHTEQGGVALTLDSRQVGDVVEVVTCVEDSGPGIGEAFQQRLFEPFTQEGGTSGEGTGLGLSISQKLVRRLGGELQVSSELAVGTRFYFALELIPCVRPPVSTTSLKVSKSGHILVAEDTKANQLVIRLMLEKEGCQVTLVENGKQAIEHACEHPYDLILMDCSMPIMDGYSATEVLRSKGCQTPILALTATTTAEAHKMCMEAGMNAVLHKPIHRASLMQAIDQWL